jgi:hypothetical protein
MTTRVKKHAWMKQSFLFESVTFLVPWRVSSLPSALVLVGLSPGVQLQGWRRWWKCPSHLLLPLGGGASSRPWRCFLHCRRALPLACLRPSGGLEMALLHFRFLADWLAGAVEILLAPPRLLRGPPIWFAGGVWGASFLVLPLALCSCSGEKGWNTSSSGKSGPSRGTMPSAATILCDRWRHHLHKRCRFPSRTPSCRMILW